MHEDEFYSLLAGFAQLSSRSNMVAFHFLIVLLIGAIVGLLLQTDVRGLESSMGLGVIYAAVDGAWLRLFVESHPLNRQRRGPASVWSAPCAGEP